MIAHLIPKPSSAVLLVNGAVVSKLCSCLFSDVDSLDSKGVTKARTIVLLKSCTTTNYCSSAQASPSMCLNYYCMHAYFKSMGLVLS